MENKKRPYPTEYVNDNYNGLTKREYFAGLAMQGLLACNATYGGLTNDRTSLAKDAIAFADALLKELDNIK